jgi:O-antigen ligase
MRAGLGFGVVLGWMLLVVLLTIYGLGGKFSPYVVLLLTVVAIPYVALVRTGRGRIFDFPAAGFLAAFGILTLAFALSSQRSDDVLIMANFIWLPLFIPAENVMKRLAGINAPMAIGRLALLGVTITLVYALYQRLALHMDRVGYLDSDPIRIANTAVIMGFLSLMGILGDTGRRRLGYLAGPALAIAVAYLAGTRGAIVSSVAIGAVAAFMLVNKPKQALLVAAALAIAGAAAIVVAAWLHVPRVDTLVTTIGQLFRGEAVTDESASIRVAMQQAGWAAFLDSPWIGHGWQRIMTAAIAHLPPGQEGLFTGQPHLHNDILDFAVAGGLLGLLAYLTLLLTPVVAAFRSARDRFYRARVFGTTVLVASYAVLGLNSLMFGFEVHTALFCGVAGVLLGCCREAA